jgi:hypothetical protein
MLQAVAEEGLLVVVLEITLEHQQMVVDTVVDKVTIPLVLQQKCLEQQTLAVEVVVADHIPELVVLVVQVVLVLHLFLFQHHYIQEHILQHPQLQLHQTVKIQF